MVPFRVFDRENKITWLILNYHPGEQGGSYLAVREDDSDQDGALSLLPAAELIKFRMVGFLDDQD